jgi:peptide/nickel transport system permease protein
MDQVTQQAPPQMRMSRSGAPRWARLRLIVRMPLPLASAILLVLLTLVAVLGPLLAADAAERQYLDLRFAAPFDLSNGWLYVFGADALGRSVLAQLAVGARATFLVAGCAVALAAVVGFALGLVCGYRGGWLDGAIMRIADVLHTLPSLLLALAVLFVLSPSMTNLILVLAITRLPVYMRVARAQALEIRERVFVEAARAIGATPSRIMFRDVRPLITPTILTVSMLELAQVMLAAAGLSFLGVGLQRPDIDWGTMVAEGRGVLADAWWVTVFPGLAVVVTALAANLLSNWMRAAGDPLQGGLLTASTLRQET